MVLWGESPGSTISLFRARQGSWPVRHFRHAAAMTAKNQTSPPDGDKEQGRPLSDGLAPFWSFPMQDHTISQ